jgi:hypothetical protein
VWRPGELPSFIHEDQTVRVEQIKYYGVCSYCSICGPVHTAIQVNILTYLATLEKEQLFTSLFLLKTYTKLLKYS